MNKLCVLLVAAFVILSAPAPAQIADAHCTTDGEIARIPTNPTLNLICNDGVWVLMKQLNANGNVRIAQSADDCSGQCGNGGELCYASNRMRLCDGKNWTELSPNLAPTVGCPQSGVFNGAQSQVLTVAAGCAITFNAWGGGGGGGTEGKAGSGGSIETVSIGNSEEDIIYYISVGGGGGSGNYVTGGVGGSGVEGFVGRSGYWKSNDGGTGGDGAASGVWTRGFGIGKPILIAAGGKGSGSNSEKGCPALAGTDNLIGSGDKSSQNADDGERPFAAGQGGKGVSDPTENASAGNDGAIHWATCAVAPCQ
jgi:hypothetical protein